MRPLVKLTLYVAHIYSASANEIPLTFIPTDPHSDVFLLGP